MGDLEGLKKVLRSLVVSTPTTMDAATLLRDYRRMLGEPLPCARHGYRDPVLFLRERCSDCFLFQGPQSNPVLTLIVPDAIKHIDQYVQSQKMPSKNIKGKRRSVPESIIRNPHTNLVSTTYKKVVEPNKVIVNSRPANIPSNGTGRPVGTPVNSATVNTNRQPKYTEAKPEPVIQRAITKETSESVKDSSVKMRASNEKLEVKESARTESLSNGHVEEGEYTRQRLQRFLERRVPAYQSQQLGLSRESLQDDDSGRQTSSSLSSRSAAALSTLHAEIARLVARRPDGVWCSELLRLYEEEYGRELPFARFRYPSVSACACAAAGVCAARAPHGDWLLRARAGPAPPAPGAEPAPSALRVRRARHAGSRASLAPLDPDDALPGIDYDPDVFPADCLSFLESVPAGSVAAVAPGDMLQLEVGEVYSPSHLWVLRLGPDHDRMEEIMDEMTEYYTKSEGKDRVLAAGARRPGQYCSSVYEGDWHRSLIVQIVDSDTVKVRHVDYGTVDTVPASGLRPLRRAWAALPAQAVRARLAGLRPAARSRRWPRAAAAACLALVRQRRLVGNVVATEPEENILELFLIDTSTEEDVNITDELIRAGHADPRPQPALGTRESYLFPLFRALEAGATPNYAEIHALLRDGIALEFVEAYRAHVPALLPSDDERDTSELGSSAGSTPPPLATNRVPFMPVMRAASPTPPPSPPSSPLPDPPAADDDSAAAASPAIVPCSPVDTVPIVASSTEVAVSPATVTVASSPAGTPSFTAAHNFSIDPRPASAASPAPPRPAAVSTPAPAPPPPAPPSCPAPAPASPACCATRAPHPPSFYALPYCPCSKAGPAPPYPFPAPLPAPASYSFPAPAPPFVFGAYRPPPRPPVFYPPPSGAYFASAPPRAPAGYAPGGAGAGAVRLSADECEVFELLSRVDPGAAHRYMREALRRARAAGPAPALNPEAAEFRQTAPRAVQPPHPVRPPPGFENR